ncbi:MAG TPA: maltose alpha-D-glucosyltransferase [Vicinamibacterales bacterium]|nr:maltose alpha-D-glucosyltransferase [Vicinamibacterales bacterium]
MRLGGSAGDPLWYKDAVIYQLHVKSFYDGNGDGIGDFRGVLQRMDYVADLGVTCLWLLPFFASPLRDDGYDVADYRSIHPDYGTLEDFQAFLKAAHDRGMQVIIELALNHTSDQHAWFQRARLAPPGSPERNYYVWSDTDQKYADVRIIFVDTEPSNWTWDAEAHAYYWHRFFSHQPDLNYDNPAVLREMLDVVDYWLSMGVDGLRLDAVPYLVERDGTSCENLPETHDVIRAIRKHIDRHYTNRMLLAEANQWPADVRAYFGDGDECHMAYHFPLMPRLFMAIHQEDRFPIAEVLARTPDIPDTCQWALFLRNHDELTLEMVTEEERDYMYLAYTADPEARLNVGIRRRLAPLLANDRRRIELMTALLFSLPGTPIIYYGDEIGMGDNIELGDRHGVRTPMQWNAGDNAGFSPATAERLYSPVISDPVYSYQAVNVEAQQHDAASLLQWMRNLVGLRKLFHVFGRGSIEFLEPDNRKVVAHVRRHAEDQILCVANLSRFAQPVALDLSAFAGATPIEMQGYTAFPEIGSTPYVLTLGAYGYYWFELQRRDV